MPGPALTVPLNGGVSLSFQRIPAGMCRMGSRGYYPDEEPCHLVQIGRPFYLGTTPVTQAQLAMWTERRTPPDGPHTNRFAGRPRHPAESVSWNDALAYCAWLNEARRAALPDGHLATLPTEAEWEYACRIVAIEAAPDGPTVTTPETEYYTGDGEAALREAGWFGESYESGSTHEVAGLRPNGAGLYDMHGNVWEWCWDAWDAAAYKQHADRAIDPGSRDREGWLRSAAEAKESQEGAPARVMRGGSWFDSAWYCRTAFRHSGWPGNHSGFVGFRVCLVSRSAEWPA